MRDSSSEHLAGVIAGTDPGSRASDTAKAELQRRDTASRQAADKNTAWYSRFNAVTTLFSLAVAIAALAIAAWQTWGK